MKGFQATRVTPTTSKHKFLEFFTVFLFCGHCCPDPDSQSNPDPRPNESGSNPDPDTKQCFQNFSCNVMTVKVTRKGQFQENRQVKIGPSVQSRNFTITLPSHQPPSQARFHQLTHTRTHSLIICESFLDLVKKLLKRWEGGDILLRVGRVQFKSDEQNIIGHCLVDKNSREGVPGSHGSSCRAHIPAQLAAQQLADAREHKERQQRQKGD